MLDVERKREWSVPVGMNCDCVASEWKYAIGEEPLSADELRGDAVRLDCGSTPGGGRGENNLSDSCQR